MENNDNIEVSETESSADDEEGNIEAEEQDLKRKIVTLSMSLLMAAVIQAITSLGHFFQNVFYLFKWEDRKSVV